MRRVLLVSSIVVLAVGPACDCGKNVSVHENSGTIQIDSNELDFGPVTEFTDAGRPIIVRNTGKGLLTLTAVEVVLDGGTEFTLVAMPETIEPGGEANVDIDFSPIGPGDDFGVVVIRSDDLEHPEVRVNLHGGPIWPGLEFDPDGGFLSFVPTSMATTSKFVIVRSAGGSSLHVTAVGVSPTGNPDFSIVRPMLPATLKPGEGLAVQVDYAKSSRDTEGLMSVNSDDADAGRRTLRLIPDPAHGCADGLDNDMDGLSDFPDDPGCSNAVDDDEYNDPECVEGAMRNCGSAIGACRPGTQLCHLGAFYPCDGGTKPMNEACNGVDDNCDGVTDEAIIDLCTINGCQGAAQCIPDAGVPGGAHGMCMPVMTMQEQCNGRDDDCDGQVDENIIETCTINGCAGTRFCLPGQDAGVFTQCAPVNPATETCNGRDDDCDGTVDDVMPAIQSCGFGVCAQTAPACVDGGTPVCMPGMPGTEVCNGIDDNCDGVADNMIMPLTCGSAGQCVNTVAACTADGGMNVCMPNPPTTEVCDNADNDCDLAIDEQADGGALTRACYSADAGTLNVGICRAGTNSCTMGMWSSGCSGEITPAAESCNNLDDNCNGTRDELPDAGPIIASCYDAGPASTRGVGACADGYSACSAGSFGPCNNQVGPSAELCDNRDNDCDTATDEQADGGALSQTCFTVDAGQRNVGRCRDGTKFCASGSYPAGCPGEITPTAESCNNIDDNCNGVSDEEADAGPLTVSCYDAGPGSTRGVGRCRDGFARCTAGAFGACTNQVGPIAEICGNSVDDNCAGGVDDGCDAGCPDAGLRCPQAPSIAPDMYEPNNNRGTANVAGSPPGNMTSSYTFNITLPNADNDWFRWLIPTACTFGQTTITAKATCANFASGACSAPPLGLEIWYSDALQTPTMRDAPPNNCTPAVAAGSVTCTTSGGGICACDPFCIFAEPQYWYVRAYPLASIPATDAIDATLQITIVNN